MCTMYTCIYNVTCFAVFGCSKNPQLDCLSHCKYSQLIFGKVDRRFYSPAQCLHERGEANADHTTLLLNCYTKLKAIDELDKFVAVSNIMYVCTYTGANLPIVSMFTA